MELPQEFVSGMRRLLGSGYSRFCSALENDAPVSVRINPLKCSSLATVSDPVLWYGGGYYLKGRIPFTFDPRFHAGLYYVQEASSMFVGHILGELVKEPVRMLDLCAAPGGKTTLALSSLPEGSFVVSNEYVSQRANILAENVIKWGYPNCAVTNNSPADYGRLRHSFDIILADAPCSGEGMFRKEPDAVAQWSLQNIAACSERQKNILSDVWDALRPGGLLIYSTCTYNTSENEDIAEYMRATFGAEPQPLTDIPAEWGIMSRMKGDIPFYRFMPHNTRGEGFSVTVMRKLDEDYIPYKPKSAKPAKVNIPADVKRYIKNPGYYDYTVRNGVLYALPSGFANELQLLDRMNILHYGVAVASVKGNEWQPHHSLALSCVMNDDAFGSLPLSLDESRSYLRRESVNLPEALRGYKTVTFGGVPLGWVKCVGMRANNLYPQEWRIRSGYLPGSDNILEFVIR